MNPISNRAVEPRSSSSPRPAALFVTGTDTGVGKTHVATIVIRELRAQNGSVGAFKPLCSGAERTKHGGTWRWDDLDRLATAAGLDPESPRLCAQKWRAALAPPLAAREAGDAVDVVRINQALEEWTGHVEQLVIEGAGGWLCPLTETLTFADWVAAWDWPVLIVARRGLGTINHTLLTIAAIRSRGLTPVGVVLNAIGPDSDDCSVVTNAAEIEARSGVPVLGDVLPDAECLVRHGQPVSIHWRNLMRPARGCGRMV